VNWKPCAKPLATAACSSCDTVSSHVSVLGAENGGEPPVGHRSARMPASRAWSAVLTDMLMCSPRVSSLPNSTPTSGARFRLLSRSHVRKATTLAVSQSPTHASVPL
jgi:hypothetical protein